MKKISCLLLFAFSFWGCEKDDICDAATATTPRIVVSFFLNGKLQALTNLKAVATGKTQGVVFNSALDDAKFLITTSTVSLPLDTNNDFTEYNLTVNFGNTILQNTDVIRFEYTRNTVFISRACGFKTTFQLKPGFPKVTDAAPADNLWMRDTNISVDNPNIVTENAAHIKISLNN